MSSSVEGSPRSSLDDKSEQSTVVIGRRSVSPTFSECSASIESLISLSDDEEETVSPQPAINARKRKFECLLNAEAQNHPRHTDVDQKTEVQRMFEYARKIRTWYNFLRVSPCFSNYTVPEIPFPECIEKELGDDDMKIADRNPYADREIAMRTIASNRRHHFSMSTAQRNKAIVMNKQQAAARYMKTIFSEDEVETCADMQFLLYHRAIEVWRDVQRQARERHDVSQPDIQWRSDCCDELAIFPIQKYAQVIYETPPLPLVEQFKRVHNEWA